VPAEHTTERRPGLEGESVPTYQYACTSCGEQLEVVQKFTDDPLTVCPSCGNGLRKVFSPVGIVFKGSGFYRTDSRKSSVPAGASSNGEGKTKANGSSDSSAASGNGKPESTSSGGSSSSDSKKSDKKVSSPASA
jgi:putative FmdB family regulatory protein